MEPYIRNNLVWIRNSLRSNKGNHPPVRYRSTRSPISQIHSPFICLRSMHTTDYDCTVEDLAIIDCTFKSISLEKRCVGLYMTNSQSYAGGHGDGIWGCIPSPLSSGFLGSLCRLCHSTFDSLEINICEPILLYLDVDPSCFCLDVNNFHQIILSLFIEGAPRGGLYGTTPNLVGGASMDRSPFRMCSCHTSWTIVDNVHKVLQDMLCLATTTEMTSR